jgi:hypothetical protein
MCFSDERRCDCDCTKHIVEEFKIALTESLSEKLSEAEILLIQKKDFTAFCN